MHEYEFCPVCFTQGSVKRKTITENVFVKNIMVTVTMNGYQCDVCGETFRNRGQALEKGRAIYDNLKKGGQL